MLTSIKTLLLTSGAYNLYLYLCIYLSIYLYLYYIYIYIYTCGAAARARTPDACERSSKPVDQNSQRLARLLLKKRREKKRGGAHQLRLW
jgi:hypothetical protein